MSAPLKFAVAVSGRRMDRETLPEKLRVPVSVRKKVEWVENDPTKESVPAKERK